MVKLSLIFSMCCAVLGACGSADDNGLADGAPPVVDGAPVDGATIDSSPALDSSPVADAAAPDAGTRSLCFFPEDTVVFPGTVIGVPASTSAFSYATAYLRDCGDQPITVTDVSMSASTDPAFQIGFPPFSGGSYTLEPGETMAVELEFHPERVDDAFTGALEVTHSGGTVESVALLGAGIDDSGGCVVQIGPTLVGGTDSDTAALDYGPVATGESVRRNILIANVSRNTCTISSLELSGDASGVFSLPYPSQINTPLTLSFRQLKLVDIDALVPAAGEYTATLTLTSDDVLSSTRTLQLSVQSE